MKDSNVRPFFLPAGLDIDELPENLRAAILEIVSPLYRDCVLEAPTALERSAGATFVFLVVLELVEEFVAGRELMDAMAGATAKSLREESWLRCLRAISATQKAGAFLMRVRALRRLALDPLRTFEPVSHEQRK